MQLAIECIYKGVREVKAGKFKTSDGSIVDYKGGYKLIFDQLINGLPRETELKIDKELALNIIPTYKPYDRFVLNLEVVIYGNNNISVSVKSLNKK